MVKCNTMKRLYNGENRCCPHERSNKNDIKESSTKGKLQSFNRNSQILLYRFRATLRPYKRIVHDRQTCTICFLV